MKGRVEGKKGVAGEESPGLGDLELASVEWQGFEEGEGAEKWSLPGDDSCHSAGLRWAGGK